MSTQHDLKQLLERNRIDPAYFDLEGFSHDQKIFQENLQKLRDLNPEQSLAPILSLHQALNGDVS